MAFEMAASGFLPEFGAIFMSNRSTMKECLERRLFGFPSSQGHFVKHVKAGMILFLFEYERRLLYGVFEACSDGAMDIVPLAFRKSGKLFPAQVNVSQIWDCDPLYEDQFSCAIKENYFSDSKFNFGLSKQQVQSLLQLFEGRKIERRITWRHLHVDEVERTNEQYSVNQKRGGNDDRYVFDKRIEENELDYTQMADISTGYHGVSPMITKSEPIDEEWKQNYVRGSGVPSEHDRYHLGAYGRDDDIILMQSRAQNEINVRSQPSPAVSTMCSACPLQGFGRMSGDYRHTVADRVAGESLKGNDVILPFSIEHDNILQYDRPSINFGRLYPENQSLATDHFEPPLLSQKEEPPISKLHYLADHGDAMASTSNVFNTNTSDTMLRISPSAGFNENSSAVQEIYPETSGVRHPLESKPSQRCMKCDICFQNGGQLPAASVDDQFGYRTDEPLPRATHTEILSQENPATKGYLGRSFLRSFEGVVPSPQGGRCIGVNKAPVSFECQRPSIETDSRYHLALSDRDAHNIAQLKNDKAFIANVPLGNEDFCQVKGFAGSFNPQKQYSAHERCGRHQRYENIYPAHERRHSVFSRLDFSVNAEMPESSDQDDFVHQGVDKNVEEVMASLLESHNQWVKTQQSKLLFQQRESTGSFGNKKTRGLFKLQDHNLETSDKITSAAGVAEEDKQVAEETPFVDFKRRSDKRKNNVNSMSNSTNANAGINDLTSGNTKRRKLVRPNFGNKPTDCTKVSSDFHEKTSETSRDRDTAGASKSSIGLTDKETAIDQRCKPQDMNLKGNNEDRNNRCEGNLEKEAKGCGASLEGGSKDGKDYPPHHGPPDAMLSAVERADYSNTSYLTPQDSFAKISKEYSEDVDIDARSIVSENMPSNCEGVSDSLVQMQESSAGKMRDGDAELLEETDQGNDQECGNRTEVEMESRGLGSEDFSSIPCESRKSVQPNFSEIGLSDHKDANSNFSVDIVVSTTEILTGKVRESFIGNHDKEDKSVNSSELQGMISQKNEDANIGNKNGAVIEAKGCGASLGSGSEAGKETPDGTREDENPQADGGLGSRTVLTSAQSTPQEVKIPAENANNGTSDDGGTENADESHPLVIQ